MESGILKRQETSVFNAVERVHGLIVTIVQLMKMGSLLIVHLVHGLILIKMTNTMKCICLKNSLALFLHINANYHDSLDLTLILIVLYQI